MWKPFWDSEKMLGFYPLHQYIQEQTEILFQELLYELEFITKLILGLHISMGKEIYRSLTIDFKKRKKKEKKKPL